MKPRVELIYDTDCPNVEEARKVLIQAFSYASLRPDWKEFDRKDADSPAHARSYGSPTILVDGKDVAGENGSHNADCCRLYSHNQQYSRVPDVSLVAQSLKQSQKQSFGWSRMVAALPSFVAVLPILHCPACWPAYAGALSTLGLAFLWQAAYLLPITACLLMMAVASFGYKARSRHGYMPMVLGLIAAAAVLTGKFWLGNDSIVYGSLCTLFAASVWNAWPRKEVCCEKN